jgi:hypothetical protein
MKNTASTDMSTPVTQPTKSKIDIQGIYEPVIDEYFERLNNGEFALTAELFAAQGCLNPPFDKQLQGREAIAQYLAEEAKGIRFFPEDGKILVSDSNHPQYQIQGKVEMNWFTVNISWLIELNAAQEIMTVDVKVLTTLDDLLSFSRI